MKWKLLSSEPIVKYKYFTAREDTCEMPSGKVVDKYFVVEIPLSVTALAITEDGKAIILKQYRHAVGEVLLEIPGGFVDGNEDLEIAIRRELKEETGFEFKDVVPLGKVYSNPGVLNKFTYLYLATGGRKTGEQNFDPNEDIKLEFVTVDELVSLIRENKIPQALHSCCIFYALEKLGKLSYQATTSS
jgi:ADP-ribose pyrophosphatase